jgi:hypothetical protein
MRNEPRRVMLIRTLGGGITLLYGALSGNRRALATTCGTRRRSDGGNPGDQGPANTRNGLAPGSTGRPVLPHARRAGRPAARSRAHAGRRGFACRETAPSACRETPRPHVPRNPSVGLGPPLRGTSPGRPPMHAAAHPERAMGKGAFFLASLGAPFPCSLFAALKGTATP